ncbi:plasmid pRiA4b ORF-3 family protein [Gracilibacillus salinarum]|uniref:Plasmid pRiA4b ORF-3 family protein n=1 Tax=Gracilibacillus salinarum TaxID=2932255 RepID=A0ABY4GH62_9BACI|nr:plasmid pRiA4b ORF-3 family protein [Gracilibacillus salinarum]UOQ83489.1 plasmid pRiA4b ORF-3 family protein [Gracilibacillus salinarum]
MKHVEQFLKQAIVDTLIADGFNEQVVRDELLADEISFTSTMDRKTVGSLNQTIQEIEIFMDKANDNSVIQLGVSNKANRMLKKSPQTRDYIWPIEEMQSLLEDKIGPGAFQQAAIQIKVSLRLETEQPVWRRLIVPLNCTFFDLHHILQKAFNWEDSHLHEFHLYQQETSLLDNYYLPKADYLLVSNEEAFDYQQDGQRMECVDQVVLGEVLGQFKSIAYNYDLGDDWQHIIEVEKRIEAFDSRYPVCLDGEGAAPPEDVGGMPGYSEFLEIITSDDHPDKVRMLSWAESAGYRPFEQLHQAGRIRQANPL